MPRLPSALPGVLLAACVPGLAAQSTPTSGAPQLVFGAEVDAQYATSSVSGHPDAFSVRRARLNGFYTLNDFVDAHVQAEFALNGGAEVRDAWVRFRFSPAVELSAGQLKRTFDRFELDSFTDLSLIERDGRVGGLDACAGVGGTCSFSRLTEQLGYAGRDQGLRLEGADGRWSWGATLTNGSGQNAAEDNEAKSLSGRMAFAVAQGWNVGAQLALHDWTDADQVARHAAAWSADLTYGVYRSGLIFQAAVVGGDNWMATPDASTTPAFRAVQGMAAWYVPVVNRRFAAVEPLLRLSWADPDTGVAADGGVLVTPGFMLYVEGKNKIGFNVDVWSPSSGATEYSLKIQSYFHI